MTDAFFAPTDDPAEFVASSHTEGPWDRRLQHAGPPSALIARAIEREKSTLDGPPQLARLTVEILGPVPVGPVTVEAWTERPGRSVELVCAELRANGREVMRARAWRVRRTHLDLPPSAAGPPSPPPERPAESAPFTQPVWHTGYLDAIEWRFAEGHFERPGPATAWARPRVPLVAGEEPTGVQRLMVLADSGNGLSQELDVTKWWFINTELTVHLHREPAGEWICMAARSTLDPSGVGLAETVLYDDAGRVGRGAQALMVGVRAAEANPRA